jgi:hypothetical protein
MLMGKQSSTSGEILVYLAQFAFGHVRDKCHDTACRHNPTTSSMTGDVMNHDHLGQIVECEASHNSFMMPRVLDTEDPTVNSEVMWHLQFVHTYVPGRRCPAPSQRCWCRCLHVPMRFISGRKCRSSYRTPKPRIHLRLRSLLDMYCRANVPR